MERIIRVWSRSEEKWTHLFIELSGIRIRLYFDLTITFRLSQGRDLNAKTPLHCMTMSDILTVSFGHEADM